MRKLILLALILAAGCSRSSAPAPAPAAVDEPKIVRIDPILAVDANRVTHLAVAGSGIYFVQETDDGRDLVRHLDELDLPQDTMLTGLAVADAIGHSGAVGNFQALAGTGNDLYFYFAGSQNRQFFACVGRWTPDAKSGGKIQVLADTEQLAKLTGAADTLSICRAEMAGSGNNVWILLHCLGSSSFLQIDDSDPAPALKKKFDQVISDFGQPDFTHDQFSVGAAPDNSILVLDAYHGELWLVSPKGNASKITGLTGVPHQIAAPAANDAGQPVLFVSGGDPIPPRLISQEPDHLNSLDFPSLLVFTDQTIQCYSGTALRSAPQFPADHLNLSALVASSQSNTWTACDAAAGEIFTLQITEHP